MGLLSVRSVYVFMQISGALAEKKPCICHTPSDGLSVRKE